jgi:hypothetical protein
MIQTPDAPYSIVEHLRGNSQNSMPDYALLTSDLLLLSAADWINTYVLDPTQMPRGCITVVAAGGPGRDADLPILRHRALIRCYHKDKMWSSRMATLTQMILFPTSQGWQGWSAAGTRIIDVTGMGAPSASADPLTKWEYHEYFLDYRAFGLVLA